MQRQWPETLTKDGHGSCAWLLIALAWVFQRWPCPNQFPCKPKSSLHVTSAAGVRMICPYIANSLHKRPNCFRVEPTENINVPSLRIYTLIPNTGQIITKVCEPNNDENESPASKKKQESPASKKESQSSKSAKSDPQGKIELPECEDCTGRPARRLRLRV